MERRISIQKRWWALAYLDSYLLTFAQGHQSSHGREDVGFSLHPEFLSHANLFDFSTSWYKPGQTPGSVLGEVSSSMEECRAETAALYCKP